MPVHGLEIRLDRSPRAVYRQGEHVTGRLVLDNKYELRHEGVEVSLEGFVDISANYKRINLLLDTFNGATRSLALVEPLVQQLAPAGRLGPGLTVLPFRLPLEASGGGGGTGAGRAPVLFETYHGVYISIQYFVKCRLRRPLFFRDLIETREILLEYDSQPIGAPAHSPAPLHFEITPESLVSAAASSRKRALIPEFRITGRLDSAVCPLDEPITGHFTIESCRAPIRSIELQLVRVETVGGGGGGAGDSCGPDASLAPAHRAAPTGALLQFSRDATEVQNIQIGDGDLMRNVPLTIYMVLPRLFTCPTLIADNFRIEFELNLVIIFADNHLLSENFPIKLIRSTLQPIRSSI